jgi:hypothetical protein
MPVHGINYSIFIMLKKGKVQTNTQQNIQLQKIFIEKGFSFMNGRKEPHIRANLHFFYFNYENKEIALGSKNDSYNNGNIFNLKFYTGLEYFKKHKNKEYKFEELIKLLCN